MDTYILAKLILIALLLLIIIVGILIAINDASNQESSNSIIRYTQNGIDGSPKGNTYHRYNGKS